MFESNESNEFNGHPDFGLRCNVSADPTTTIVLNQVNYYVKDIDEEAHVLKIVRTDLYDSGICYYDQSLSHTTEIDSELFHNVFIQTGDYGSEGCNNSVTVPVAKNTTLVADALQEAISEGFELKWDLSSYACEDYRNSSGSCGFDSVAGFVCYCPNHLSGFICANSTLPIIQSHHQICASFSTAMLNYH
ncbi:hypothetical protein Q3G72_025001 [Acer saccharum]|nr:hypothetical protein Q3G72_025001 [Acer saccharum]